MVSDSYEILNINFRLSHKITKLKAKRCGVAIPRIKN